MTMSSPEIGQTRTLEQGDHEEKSIGQPRPPLSYGELVERSPQGSIFAYPWWLEAVAPGKHEIIEIKRGGAVLCAWPVVRDRSEHGIHYFMPGLTQRLGILFAPSSGKSSEVQSMNRRLTLELLEKVGGFYSFQQNFHENFTDWLPFYWAGFSQTCRYTYVLEDLSDEKELWANLRTMCRKEIRKAQKAGIRVVDDFDLSRFADLNRKTYARQGLNPEVDDEYVWRLDVACAKNAGRRIFAGIDSLGRPHAAVYIVWANGTAYSLIGGGDPELRQSSANRLAYWEAILFARTVAKRFDFVGSILPQVEAFNRSFGAKQLPYFSISKSPPSPASLREHVKMSAVFRINRLRKKFGLV